MGVEEGQEDRRRQMSLPLESTPCGWRESLPDIKEKESQTTEDGIWTQGTLEGKGVGSGGPRGGVA